MKRAVGIDFTEGFVKNLRQRGFTCTALSDSVVNGFQSYFFPLKDLRREYDGFEIHVVYDEVEYLRFMGFEHFCPFIKNALSSAAEPKHLNTVEAFESVIFPSELKTSELNRLLELRKNFPIAALELKCRSLKEFFRIANPQRTFEIRGETAALLQLGPSCFDLLITESNLVHLERADLSADFTV